MKEGSLRLKLQLLCGDCFAIGPGKADLLAAIDAQGSISAAGRALEMSYRRAWLLVDEMNRCFETPLVETLRGGGRERGARLTDAGREVLTDYRALEAQAASVLLGAPYARLTARLREKPLPADTR
jgi:molybdate transport system regulatory protein